MGQASMRKWLRRAETKIETCATDRVYLVPSPYRDTWDCPVHGEAISGMEMVLARSQLGQMARDLRLKHRGQRRKKRFERAMIAVMEAHKDAIIARSHIKLAIHTVLERARHHA